MVKVLIKLSGPSPDVVHRPSGLQYEINLVIIIIIIIILDFRLSGWFHNVDVSTIEAIDPKNIGVAAAILFLSGVELEKPWG